MLDKQIRSLIEYDVKHVKVNNGFFFFVPTGFLAIEKWYGQRVVLGRQIIWYRKRVAALYDSYALFDTLTDGAISAQGEPRSGGSPCADTASLSATDSADAGSVEVRPGEMREPLADRIKTVIARLLRALRLPCGQKCDLGAQQDARPEQQKGRG